jgi:hypothetical protein
MPNPRQPQAYFKKPLAWVGCLAILLGIVACEGRAVPTLMTIGMAQTAAYLTEVAPPPGFARVNFAPIDKNLDQLPHWHYVVSLSFSGTYADTGAKVSGLLRAEVFSNQITGERRVILRATGEIFAASGSSETARDVEGVRLGNDFYFVDQNGACSNANTLPERKRVAELTAGSLIGGVRQADFTTTKRQNDSLEVLQYAFLPGNVEPPVLEMTQGGKVTIASGELWIAPSLRAVRSYSLTLNIDRVILPVFQAGRQLTGQLTASYNLVEVNTPYNIAIPFGC